MNSPHCLTTTPTQALELDPSGTMLYAAGGAKAGGGLMTTFSVDAATGELAKVGEVEIGNNPIRLLAVDFRITS